MFASDLTWVLKRQNKAKQSLVHLHFGKYELNIYIKYKTWVCKCYPQIMHCVIAESIINSINQLLFQLLFLSFLFMFRLENLLKQCVS